MRRKLIKPFRGPQPWECLQLIQQMERQEKGHGKAVRSPLKIPLPPHGGCEPREDYSGFCSASALSALERRVTSCSEGYLDACNPTPETEQVLRKSGFLPQVQPIQLRRQLVIRYSLLSALDLTPFVSLTGSWRA